MKDIRRTLVFFVTEDEILLAMKKRGFGADLWNGVGGKLEVGETVEQAMIRESQEEVGVTPVNYHKVAELDFYGGSVEEGWRIYVHAYLCDKWTGEPVESEEMAPQWYKQSEIPYDVMWQGDEEWIPRALRGELLKGKLTFDDKDKLLSAELSETTFES